MRKKKEQINKLNRFLVLSIILHVLLFSFIIWSSLEQVIKLGGSEVIDVDAIMIDPGAAIEQYTQLKQQHNSPKQADAEEKKRLQQQKEEFRKQQEEEQKLFKTINEERIKIEREDKQQHRQTEETAKQAEEQKKRAKELSDKAKEKQERLIKEQAKATARVKEKVKKESEIVKSEAQIESKEKAGSADKALMPNKKKTDVVKQDTAVYSLLGGLTAKQPFQQIGTLVAVEVGNRKSGASSLDVANYADKIKAAIERKFYNSDIYLGKTCELKIKLAPDGMLISVSPKSNTANDQSLCDAAIRAIKTATMPKPSSRSIYDAFNEQGSTLVFKP
ncbi:MAG: cell envelope integrity protein TolA [Arsenophonus sp. NC-CH8-MAG3]